MIEIHEINEASQRFYEPTKTNVPWSKTWWLVIIHPIRVLIIIKEYINPYESEDDHPLGTSMGLKLKAKGTTSLLVSHYITRSIAKSTSSSPDVSWVR